MAATGSFCSSGVISTGNNQRQCQKRSLPEDAAKHALRSPEPEPFENNIIIDAIFTCNRATQAPGCDASSTIRSLNSFNSFYEVLFASPVIPYLDVRLIRWASKLPILV